MSDDPRTFFEKVDEMTALMVKNNALTERDCPTCPYQRREPPGKAIGLGICNDCYIEVEASLKRLHERENTNG